MAGEAMFASALSCDAGAGRQCRPLRLTSLPKEEGKSHLLSYSHFTTAGRPLQGVQNGNLDEQVQCAQSGNITSNKEVSVCSATALLCFPSPEDQDSISSLLADLGLASVPASTPAAAVELARSDRFACLLLDADRDPRWQFTVRTLCAEAPAAIVVVYSRLPDERLWIDALEAGAFDFLCKPLSSHELQSVLEHGLRSRSVSRETTSRPAPAGAASYAHARGA
jgi:CheY-like chemotaxis protein